MFCWTSTDTENQSATPVSATDSLFKKSYNSHTSRLMVSVSQHNSTNTHYLSSHYTIADTMLSTLKQFKNFKILPALSSTSQNYCNMHSKCRVLSSVLPIH